MKAKVIETGEIIDVQCLYPTIYSRLDGNGKIIEEYNDDELEFPKEKATKIVKKHIFDFDGEWKLAKYPPKEEGYYMTIRCGLGGIYTCLDEWKDNRWQVGVLDDSNVISYTKEQVTKEAVKEWCDDLMKKYKK